MSDRTTSHDGNKSPSNRTAADFSKFTVHDSFSNSTDVLSSGEGGDESKRVSLRRLEEIDKSLSERSKKILISLQKHRYMLTSQVQRLYFYDAVSASAALRATTRTLKSLSELGLIDHLARRIGGVRAGSGALVWYLTHAGERLLRLHEQRKSPIKRFFEPSPYFLAHCLAVADIAAEITEMCRKFEKMQLIELQPEPECWRTYSEYGSAVSLKPDLFAVTASNKYEDCWFIEVDLNTESPAKVIEKCERYHRYYRSGLEQDATGVFPLTVWIVPDVDRKNRLISAIRAAFDKQPKLFAVILKDELEALIRQGGEEGALC